MELSCVLGRFAVSRDVLLCLGALFRKRRFKTIVSTTLRVVSSRVYDSESRATFVKSVLKPLLAS